MATLQLVTITATRPFSYHQPTTHREYIQRFSHMPAVYLSPLTVANPAAGGVWTHFKMPKQRRLIASTLTKGWVSLSFSYRQ